MQTNIYHRPAEPFLPHVLARGGDRQTLLARGRRRHLIVQQIEQPILLDAGKDYTGYDTQHPVRLLGYYAPSLSPVERRGLVVILHGWEGCSHSPYNLLLTDALVHARYDVFRLNLRDHGPGKHVDPYALNRGLFLATLIEEATTAVQRAAELAGDLPVYLIGASMGGNFALRMAARHEHHPIANLKRVVAFNPVINPSHAMDALDSHAAYRRYFRTEWLSSLRAKAQLYPELYNFAALAHISSLRQLTDQLFTQYPLFPNAESYFATYAIAPTAFTQLTVPTTIITAADDPVIPVVDFYTLAPHPLLQLDIHPTGGHVGYVDLFPFEHRLPQLALAALSSN